MSSRLDFMVDVNPVDDKLNVFISYSRDDLDFADQLDEALQLVGFATSVDRHRISGGEEWQARLGSLIRDADTVVFVLSPASAKSDICAWEVEEAARLNKRIIPVLCRPLDGAVPSTALAQRNYIFFYAEPKSPGSGFGQGLRRLVAALNTDLDWLREHTRLLKRATEWEMGGRSANRLLTGEDIAAARAWAARRPKGAPEPTELHLAFLRASEDEDSARVNAERRRLEEMAAAQEERQRAIEEREAAVKRAADAQKARIQARRVLLWGSAAAVALFVLGVLGFAAQQTRSATEQATLRVEAERAKAVAEQQSALAKAKTLEAEEQAFLAQAKTREAEEQAALTLVKSKEAEANLRESVDVGRRHAA
jgi:TIR domain